jgi:hypothetical protein
MTRTTMNSQMALEGKWIVTFIRLSCVSLYPVAITLFVNYGTLVTCRCIEQINKASRGDLTPEELQERQVSSLSLSLSLSLSVTNVTNSGLVFSGKGHAGS